MELSRRLYAVASLVTPGNRLADVGTDHGYLPIYLVKEGRIPWAVALDVNQGPLMRAREHILREGLQELIETRLSDGLQALAPGETDSAVIAGMGGALTIRILEEGTAVLTQLKELILQPQSELARVRRWLAEHGMRIMEETMVLEDGKYYPMMRLERGRMELTRETEALYGPVLLRKKHPCLWEYLQWEYGIKEKILRQLRENGGAAAGRRIEEVELALRTNREAWREITGDVPDSLETRGEATSDKLQNEAYIARR